MASSDEMDPGVKAGDVLAGKYRVERVLGVGGMGVVVAAHHIQLDEKVALKFLLPAALRSPEALGRFEREARAAVKIKSEHVARVSDVGRLENGAPYMVMEYLDGGDLQEMLTRGPLPADQAVEFVLQACEAIAEAHALGIVHRDLKPSNLFVVRRADGLLSVGISKVSTGGADMGMTRTTAIIGSPLYMSPEQMQSSKGVDPRTDIWSLGVILFELVTGRVPFEADTVTELAVKVCTSEAPPLRSVRAELSPELEDVTARCLSKDRAQRFANLGELALALRPLAPAHALASVDRILRTMNAAGMSRAPAPAPSLAHQATALSGPAATKSSWGQTGGGTGAQASASPQKKDARLVAASVAALALIVLAGAGVLVAWRHPAMPGATGSAAAVATVTPGPQVASGLASGSPAEILSSELPAPSISAPPIAARFPPATILHTPAAPPGSAASPAKPVAAPPKPNCSTPYYIDSDGHRQYKPECL
jgi:hypothetical protein